MPKAAIARKFSNRMAQAAFQGNTLVVPRRFSDGGRLVQRPTRSGFIRLSRRQASFLIALDRCFPDIQKACVEAGVAMDWAERFLKSRRKARLDLDEQRTRVVASVATPEWTKAKMVEGVTGDWQPKNEKVATKCLEMLKDITHPRSAQTNIQVNNTAFNLPQWTPETEAKVRQLADQLADVPEAEVVRE